MSPDSDKSISVDAFIVGSGPIGSAFARRLVEAGRSVLVVDAGAKLSDRPGEHLKNAYLYQRNLDMFSPVIRGHLTLLSVPSNDQAPVTLDPAAFQVDSSKYDGFVHNNQNPDQDPNRNLPAAAASYIVGGMATHWTCATPRHHPNVELADCIPTADWDDLYTQAEALLNTRRDVFEHSIRHQVVREALVTEYRELPEPYAVQNLPLAVERRHDNPRFVRWSGSDTVLGPLAEGAYPDTFNLQPQWLCTRLHLSSDGQRVEFAEVQDLTNWRTIRVDADVFVVACGAVLTPQLLYASGIRPEPLGRYLCEQPVAFCQIVLHQDLVDAIAADERFADRIRQHAESRPHDPVPIPGDDPEPQVWIPVSDDRPWHCQIHRDAFHYGDVSPNVDARLIVDLRWFGITAPRPRQSGDLLRCPPRHVRDAAAHLRVLAQQRRPPAPTSDDARHAPSGGRARRVPPGLRTMLRRPRAAPAHLRYHPHGNQPGHQRCRQHIEGLGYRQPLPGRERSDPDRQREQPDLDERGHGGASRPAHPGLRERRSATKPEEVTVFDRQKVSLGITPTCWINDDFPTIGSDISFEQCVSEIALAGFEGCSVGHTFPSDPEQLREALQLRGLRVSEPWVSTYFTVNEMTTQTIDNFRRQLEFIHAIGGTDIGTAELGNAVHQQPVALLANKPVFNDHQWQAMVDGLNELGARATDAGMRLCYHHHMGTGVQTRAEVDRLLADTDPDTVHLLLDTGHLTWGGGDAVELVRRPLRPHQARPPEGPPPSRRRGGGPPRDVLR